MEHIVQKENHKNSVLFVQFSTRLPHAKKGAIEIMYPERFHEGKFRIGAVIPIEKFSMKFVEEMIGSQTCCDAAIINRDVGPCLRLLWIFSTVPSSDTSTAQRLAREKAALMEAKFGMKSYIVPIGGLYEMLIRLSALDALAELVHH